MDETLPSVTAALICERVLTEKDDVLSAIRVFDRLMYMPLPADIGTADARLQFTYLVMLRRGFATESKYQVTVVIRAPSGREIHPTDTPLEIEFAGDDPDAGVNLQIGMRLKPSEEGPHWLGLTLNNRAL